MSNYGYTTKNIYFSGKTYDMLLILMGRTGLKMSRVISNALTCYLQDIMDNSDEKGTVDMTEQSALADGLHITEEV